MKKAAREAPDRLISGKLRAKAGRRGAANTVIQVDGVDYTWARRHSWQVWGKGIHALSLSVCLSPDRTRELILDFALRIDAADGPPPDARVQRVLEAGIRAAREAGWDPESRGRAFRHAMDEPD